MATQTQIDADYDADIQKYWEVSEEMGDLLKKLHLLVEKRPEIMDVGITLETKTRFQGRKLVGKLSVTFDFE